MANSQTAEQVYKAALDNQDYTVAIQSLYQMIQQTPKKLALQDSLASLYFRMGAFQQCQKVAQKLLKKTPNNYKALEMLASAEKQIGEFEASLKNYQALYQSSNDVYYLYHIANLQYYLRDYEASEKSLVSLLETPNIEKEKVFINIGDSKVKPQEVPLKAAVLNIQGVIHSELDKKDKAIEFFHQSLAEFEDFELAENNLAMLLEEK